MNDNTSKMILMVNLRGCINMKGFILKERNAKNSSMRKLNNI